MLKDKLEESIYSYIRGLILKWIGLGVSGVKGFLAKYLYDFLFDKIIYRGWIHVKEFFQVKKAKRKRAKTFDKAEEVKTDEELADNFNDMLNGR